MTVDNEPKVEATIKHISGEEAQEQIHGVMEAYYIAEKWWENTVGGEMSSNQPGVTSPNQFNKSFVERALQVHLSHYGWGGMRLYSFVESYIAGKMLGPSGGRRQTVPSFIMGTSQLGSGFLVLPGTDFVLELHELSELGLERSHLWHVQIPIVLDHDARVSRVRLTVHPLSQPGAQSVVPQWSPNPPFHGRTPPPSMGLGRRDPWAYQGSESKNKLGVNNQGLYIESPDPDVEGNDHDTEE